MLILSNLHGFNVMPPSAVAAELSFITSVLGNTSAGTIAYPAHNAGDILVLAHEGFGDTAPANVIPSGWTSIQTQASSSGRTSLAYKLATGSESGSFAVNRGVFGGEGGDGSDSVMAVFRSTVPATSLTLGGAVGTASTGNPTAQNITAASGAAPLIVVAAYGTVASGGGVNPRTMTPTKTGELQGNFANLWLAYLIYNAAPANVSIDMDDEGGGNMLMGGYLAVSS